jgi:hypothetical protein
VDAQKLQLKIFATAGSARTAPLETFIPVFHRWIKERALPELLIDVANYIHVPEGPGVVLIGHGSDYFMDQGAGRLGLLYSRKRAGPPPAARLDDLARRTLHAAWLLEREPLLLGHLFFETNELLFRVNDRLAAPNTDATWASLKPELEALGRRMFAAPFEITRVGGPAELLSVRVTTRVGATLATLLDRFGGPLPPAA